ncbi:uncharacterized protein EI90DRAFT_3102876, partial [Cantharellus anzutake]|uniref:uncharacterized protein n=1 Tax=Cantharellus anzutake TaxID=1750568 RepID=UPI00190704E7
MLVPPFARRAVVGLTSHYEMTPSRGLLSTLLLSTEKWTGRSANELRREANATRLSQGRNTRVLVRRFAESLCAEVHTQLKPAAFAPAARMFVTSAQSDQGDASSKFTPRRRKVLEIKLPEEPEVPDEGPIIPYLPDNFLSKEKCSTQAHPERSTPRVMTVASASTHHDGGPSHNLHEAGDAHLFEVGEHGQHEYGASDTPSPGHGSNKMLFSLDSLPGEILEVSGIPKISLPFLKVSESEAQPGTRSSELDGEHRKGLFVLGGILG